MTARPPAAPAAAAHVDLHTHSTASDGAMPPEKVVETARAAGLAAIALTDHDTLGGVAAAQAAGARVGLRVVAGVELSAFDGDREIHVLGLHIADVARLDGELVQFREGRAERAAQIVAKLNALGVPVTLDAVLAEAAGGAIGRPHIARAMIAGRWARDPRDAFDRYLGAGRPAFVDKRRLTIADSIRLIHEAGGLALLAHPGPEGTRERVERFLPLGLDGLEVRHPGHTADDTARLGALVEHFRLVPTGGSDWHGALGGPRVLGAMRIPYAWLERQEERLARVRSGERAA